MYLIESHRRGALADWASVVVPQVELDRLGTNLNFRTAEGNLFPAYLHRKKGRQGASYRIAMPFVGHMVAGKMVPSSKTEHARMVIAESLSRIKDPVAVGLSLKSQEVVESSCVERVERYAFGNARETVIVWKRTRHLHPVVDYGVRWSRRMDDGWMPAVMFPGVEDLRLMPGHGWKDMELAADCIKSPNIVDARCAPTVWLRATYPAISDEGPVEASLRATVDGPAPVGMFMDYRRLMARRTTDEWPDDIDAKLVGTARWLTLGVVPTDRPKNEHLDVSTRGIYDRRPGAQALSANQAGTQRFGCADGASVTSMSPLSAMNYMRQVAGDEELRPIHYYYEKDAKPLDARKDMDLRTHNRRIDWRNSKNKLWFEKEPPRVTTASKRTTDDEQHMDDLGVDAFLAVFDDPALEETRKLMIHLDALDTQTLSGRINSAARGTGRPLLSAANAAWLFDGTDEGLLAQATAQLMVAALAGNWEGRRVPIGRPIRPVSTLKGVASWNLTDPRDGQPMRAAAPYEHATVVAGLLAVMQILDPERRKIAKGLAKAIGNTLIHWAYEDLDGGARWPFIVACKEDVEDGEPLDREWCNIVNPEFSQTHVVGGSWTTWTMPGIAAASALMELPEAIATALRLERREALETALTSRFTAIDTELLAEKE